MAKKPYLSGAVISCVPTLGWWYWAKANSGFVGIYGPFFTRDAARRDRKNRLEGKRKTFRVPVSGIFSDPIRVQAEVRVVNGESHWYRTDLHESGLYRTDLNV